MPGRDLGAELGPQGLGELGSSGAELEGGAVFRSSQVRAGTRNGL